MRPRLTGKVARGLQIIIGELTSRSIPITSPDAATAHGWIVSINDWFRSRIPTHRRQSKGKQPAQLKRRRRRRRS
jgi:hypothetical protein